MPCSQSVLILQDYRNIPCTCNVKSIQTKVIGGIARLEAIILKIFYSILPEKFSDCSLDLIRLFFQNSTTLHKKWDCNMCDAST